MLTMQGPPASRFDRLALRLVRVTRGKSQREFVAATPYAPSAIAQVEAGRQRPSLKFLETLAVAHGFDIRDLFRAV